MPEEAKNVKSKKLAAARKKLKEYQNRGADSTTTTTHVADVAARESSITTSAVFHEKYTSTGSVSSHLSEHSDLDLNFNSNATMVAMEGSGDNATATPAIAPVVKISENVSLSMDSMSAASSYFNELSQPTSSASLFTSATPVAADLEQHLNLESQQNINAMQVLIAEKAQLTADLSKYRTVCHEKDFEVEELRAQYGNTAQRLEDLQKRFLAQQQSIEQLRNTNAELQHKLAQAATSGDDQVSYLQEIKQQLNSVKPRIAELEDQIKTKDNELELAHIRIRQLSDESSIGKDDRVETLTQTKFMYEQQIRDLQAMVQQLSQDKEQANIQYQNYVQHLNAEVANFNERNNDLTDECAKLQERERQLVEHISGLEREIQRNINLQDQLRDKGQTNQEPAVIQTPEMAVQLTKLEEKICGFEFERHEFQLKIKSQEDHLQQLKLELDQKCSDLELMKDQLDHASEGQPDTVKLLATMESDKVAASRALSQNVELKKQLDELELRFVQLTNDKADLTNKLDAEEYANREMRSNYTIMEGRLQSTDERFKFKDEEMIRLSHENMELKRKNLVLQKQIDYQELYEVKRYDVTGKANVPDNGNSHDEHGVYDGNHDNHDHHHDGHEHSHIPNVYKNSKQNANEINTFQDKNETSDKDDHSNGMQEHDQLQYEHSTSTPHIATAEAVEKLQLRFTQLMSQVAELTEEKQRLEHLVLQLQGETETIGEYIALYQTQRRMLKQREYEKAAQMQLLQAEREQMREKIAILNNLVSSLGVELPPDTHTSNVRVDLEASRSMQEHLSAALTSESETYSTIATNGARDELQQQYQHQNLADAGLVERFHSTDTQQIFKKIQDIISEIKENTKEVPTVVPTVDHLNCCLGKFEVV